MGKSIKVSQLPNAPAFSAYRSTDQSISNTTWTKVQLNAEEFDTASAFDSATNFRFTPQVAGYYQISAGISFKSSNWTENAIGIYKNGSLYKNGPMSTFSAATGFVNSSMSALVYLNGSTDYIELYGYVNATTPGFAGTQAATYMQGALVRVA